MARLILCLNSGSSTLKGSMVEAGAQHALRSDSSTWDDLDDRPATLRRVMTALDSSDPDLVAVAHRVVHGGARFTAPVLVDDEVLGGIEGLSELAPLHNDVAVDVIRLAREMLPDVPHVACFDTSFHATLPEGAWRYPVPYAWYEQWGVRKYGFHGLSVEWSVQQAARELGRPVEQTCVVVAHLGSGCSVTAVANGESVWTSMGFTPLEGLMMATRSGSIDPGVIFHLANTGNLPLADIQEALEHQSGLAGVSGHGTDMRAIRSAAEAGDRRAQLAIDMFVARVAEGIAAAMTWINPDALVFTGGIGEHDEATRSSILRRLRLNESRVLVVEAREDVVMADAASKLVA
jgi:acetate kinase